jgi:hypothetical protein
LSAIKSKNNSQQHSRLRSLEQRLWLRQKVTRQQ